MTQDKGLVRFVSGVAWVMVGLVLLLAHVSRFPATQEAAPITIFVFCVGASFIWLEAERLTGGFSYRHCLNPKNASWAFLATPLVAAAVAIFAWLCPPDGWQRWLLVIVLALAAGALGPMIIRKLDYARYKSHGALGSYNSKSKLAYDYLGLRVLAASATGLGVHAAVYAPRNAWFWVAMACIAVWALADIKDAIWPPNPLRQHANKPGA